MADTNRPLERESYRLLGAAFEVHNVMGGGLLEEIYQQSMEIELKEQRIAFLSKPELSVYYKGVQLETKYIPDLVVFDRIVVELKAVAALCPNHEAQLMNYMRITHQPLGYLLNFGPLGKLEHRRFILSQFLPEENRK